MDEILVEEYRGDLLECVHRGYICITGDGGQVVHSVGDSDFITYMRSSAKPIQVLPLLEAGLEEKYGFTDKEITVMAASHRAQPWHVKAIEGIMEKTGIKEEELICLPTYPLAADAKEKVIVEGGGPRRIYHNCSGKHMGILTLCTAMGCDKGNYFDINSPAQQEILEHIAYISEYPKEKIIIGVDGCGVPVFGMPMKNLANAYRRLACPDTIDNEKTRNAVIKLSTLMNENYEMISGTNLICTLLNQDPNIVAKGGAKGVYCFGLKEERLGVSIKIIDGSEDEWPIIVATILEQLNYKNKETIQRLRRVYPNTVTNDNKKIVGESKVVFKL
ncbi:MAG: asparaginase [Clostridium sp.]|nr:asparaginase [Clostridium sp.]MDU7084702.1 asparaginase [Clostridium sp.]